jgi:hypothetical protein
MTSVAPPLATAAGSMSVDAWQDVMRSVDGCDKSTMNSIVMNWLIVEGYQHVAEQFQEETETHGQRRRHTLRGNEVEEASDADAT